MTIVEFLRARLAEDERKARAACEHTDSAWRVDGDGETLLFWDPMPDTPGTSQTLGHRIVPHVARHDPARVVAEVEAKRRILVRHHPSKMAPWAPAGCEGCGTEGDGDDPITEHIDECPELRDLAVVYADHPDYRQEWSP